MPNELIVSIKADTSGLSAGLADATGQVTASAADMAAAQNAVTAATLRLAQSQELLTNATRGGAGSIKFATQCVDEDTAALRVAQAVLDGFVQSERAAAAAAAEAAAAIKAQAKAAAAAAAEAAAANRQLGVSGQQAALGGVRVLEGSLMGSSRAAGMFLSNTLGLGKVLSAAFPVIGALALGAVLIDVGEGIVKFTEEAEELGNTLGTGWLDGAILQLVGLGDQIKKTEKDTVEFEAKVDQSIERQKEIQASITGIKEGPVAEAQAKADILTANNRTLDTTLTMLREQLRLEQAIANDPSLKAATRGDSVGGLFMKGIAKFAPTGLAGLPAGESAIPEVAAQNAAKTQAQIDATLQHMAENAQKITELTLAVVPKPPAADKTLAGATDNMPGQIARAQIDAAHAADAALPVAARINAEYLKELDLHKQNAAASKEGTAAEREMLRVIEDEGSVRKRDSALFTAGTAELKKNQEEIAKAAEEQAKHQSEIEKHAVEEFKRAQEERVSAARETAEAEIKAADDTFEAREREIKFEETLGRISHQRATQELLDAENTKAAMMTLALRKEQQIFDPTNGPKELQEFTSVEDKITAEARKAALQREQITQQEAQKFNQAWKKASATFNSDMTTAFNAWATHSQTAGQAWGHMLGEMELQMADFVIKTILQKAEQWAEIKVMDALGFATAKATGGVANVAAAASNAAVAATGAAAAMAAIPVVGPALAVGAATTMTASMAPFIGMAGDYDTGGMLPTMSMAFNRSGSPERILSPSQTSNFESMVNNGGQRSATLNQTNHFGGGVTPDMLAAHTAQTMSKLKGMLRPEAFA
jgi:hypothetical protein